MPTYDPSKVSIIVGSNIMIARGESTFVKAARNEDGFSLKMSSDGLGTRVKNPNKSGTFEITLIASSPANDLLQAQAIQDEQAGTGIVPVTVEDGTGTAFAQGEQVWIKKIPDLERAKEDGEVTWVMETPLLNLNQGGTTAP